jgi:hypothetical protein
MCDQKQSHDESKETRRLLEGLNKNEKMCVWIGGNAVEPCKVARPRERQVTHIELVATQ